jgi:HAD superfamily hydrolase (TIGR01509 family)
MTTAGTAEARRLLRRPLAALFDLDGTLLDSVGFLNDAFRRFLASAGIPGPVDAAAYDGLSIAEIADAVLWGRDLPRDAGQLSSAYLNGIQYAYEQRLQPFDGAGSALQRLRNQGFRLGLVTSAVDSMVSPLLARIGWGSIFDAVVCGDGIKQRKPAPDCYHAAMALLQLPADRIIAVEDSPNGVLAARAAGLTVIGISAGDRGAQLRAAGAIEVVRAATHAAEIMLSGDLCQ